MNFVLFFPDEMRASGLSCYGNPVVQTPAYDRLAAEGTRFDGCFVQNPVCSPSRCSLMTGLYVHNAGHRTLWHLLRPHEPSLFRYLKNAGYEIAWFGKNDLYSQPCLEELCGDLGKKRGGYPGEAAPPQVHGGENPYPLEDPRHDSFLYAPIPAKEPGLPVEEDIARAVRFLESRKPGDAPFMLYLPIGLPHPVYNAPEAFYGMYDPEAFRRQFQLPGGDMPSYGELIRRYRRLDTLEDKVFLKIQAVYHGMISYVDRMLELLLDTLRRTGHAGDTTVIVSSDHGDWAGDRGLVEKWPNAMDDDLVRVPLIIRTPGGAAGHTVREPVELFDIMPTVLELAGISANHTHFARSLLPQLRGAAGDPGRAVFCEGGYDAGEPHCFEGYPERPDSNMTPGAIYYPKLLQQQEHPESVCRSTMIRTATHKLVLRTSGENELYDLQNDPRELQNRYGAPTCAGIQTELSQRMLQWYIRTSDTVPRDEDPRGFH